jgi:hypothetical protein
MKTFTAVLLLLGPLQAIHSLAGNKPETPIIVDVSIASADLSITVNDRVFTEKQLAAFLQQNKAQFGDADPVYLRFSNDVSIGRMFELMDLVKQTHPTVHLIVTRLQKEIRLFDPDLNHFLSSRPSAPAPSPWTTRLLFDNPPNPMLHQRQQPLQAVPQQDNTKP